MWQEPLEQALLFLVDSVLDFYILLLFLRFWLQVIRADFYNPLCQFVIKLTQPPVTILRRILPGYAGLDASSLVLAFVLEGLKFFLLLLIDQQQFANPIGLLVISLVSLLKLWVQIFFYAILLQVIASWFHPNPYHPLFVILQRITHPLLSPIQRRFPPIQGFDLSPLPAMILLQLAQIIFITPLFKFGLHLL